MKAKDLSGKRFSSLIVESRAENISKRAAWNCLCDCGEKTITTGDRLLSGKTKSCGCLRKTVGKEISEKYGFKAVHGKTKSLAFRRWQGMLDRCKETAKASKRYFERGIKVCEEWKKFENFYNDMGDPPVGMTLDRIDNNLGYSKENCRWATIKEQTNNRERTRFLVEDGQKIAVMDWADKHGIKKNQAQYFYSTLVLISAKNIDVSLWKKNG